MNRGVFHLRTELLFDARIAASVTNDQQAGRSCQRQRGQNQSKPKKDPQMGV